MCNPGLLLSDNKSIGKCSEGILLKEVNRDRIKYEVLHPIGIGRKLISIGVCLGVGVLV